MTRDRARTAEGGPGGLDPVEALIAAAAAIVSERMRADGTPGPALGGVGWATVDRERAMAELGAALGLDDAHGSAAPTADGWADARRDPLLGASAVVRWLDVAPVRRTARSSADMAALGIAPRVALVVLEPDTEGRLAAFLARHGEGVGVAYVAGAIPGRGAPARDLTADVLGPLGPSRLAPGSPPGGPQVVLVDMASSLVAPPGSGPPRSGA